MNSCIFFTDSSLDDIKYVLNPTFDRDHIAHLDKNDKLSRAIDGSMYSPGIVGMNNIKANDYCNVVLQVSGPISLISYYFIKCFSYFITFFFFLTGTVSCYST